MTSDEQKFAELQSVRGMLDLAVCFVMTVGVLRGFFLEGYLVSTGSMAPVLLGFHKSVVCPACEYRFAFGVRFDESVDGDSAAPVEKLATCPNCGQINIDATAVPRNHGDQLLVHKNIFDFRRPHRWEPVVFRNPAQPGEAYVKRVVGLPEEDVRILDGDLYVNGRMARKDLVTQRHMRIPLFNLRNLPDDDEWELPWQLDGKWEAHDGVLRGQQPDQSDQPNSLLFRHWRWFGGTHSVEVPLSRQAARPDWTDFLRRYNQIPVSWTSRLDYDDQGQVLRCQGVMPIEMQQDLMKSATNEEFRRAIYRLAALSHLAPVTDHYGYNSRLDAQEYPVADLMLDMTVTLDASVSTVQIGIPLGSQTWTLTLEPQSGMVRLQEDGVTDVRREAVVSADSGQFRIEVSNFDRRLLVAVDGRKIFTPVDLPASLQSAIADFDQEDEPPGRISTAKTARRVTQQNRLQLSFLGGSCQISNLEVFRDVYYTTGRSKHGVTESCQVAPDCYFVTGDNSPVSFDSRSWDDPFVPHRLLVGKPFVVHLPSRPGRLAVGSGQVSIRIPDFQRIRYIP